MKNLLIFVLSLLLIQATGCGETINSTWKSQEITTDGNGDDWEGIPLQYQEDMKIVYGIVNDNETVYFIIRFNDTNLARMFSMRGFTLWLSDEDSEKKLIGIHYRDDAMRDQFKAEGRKRSERQEQQGQPPFQSAKPGGKFTLAKNNSLTATPIADLTSFEAAADAKDGVFCYEFSIPLIPLDGSPYYLNLSDQKIKVGLEIVGMTEEEKENLKAEMEERRGSMQGGNMGGRSGGGRKGGMRDGGKRGGGSRPQMPEMDGEEYWISIHLANK
jgi:hypothetical protein